MLVVRGAESRLNRRQWLRRGAAALGGWSLASDLGWAAGESSPLLTGKSVIFLFLHGGPSQFETFDPKMTAPAEIRSVTGEIATAVPGVTYGSSFPRLAQLADKITVVRSFTTGDGNHDIKPLLGRATQGANLGSLYARVVGAAGTATGMPANVMLFPRAVDTTAGPEQTAFGKLDSAGTLGSGAAPVVPGAGGDWQSDLELQLPWQRMQDRRAVLSALDRAGWQAALPGRPASLDPLRQQAFGALESGRLAAAFDLGREPPAVLERYDTAPLVRPEAIDTRWNNRPYYIDNGKTLGKLLLLARRLCEAGAGFVGVTTNFVWDMHADDNNAPMDVGMGYLGPPLDWALSALIEDLHQRGLSDRVLVVACGEMGRTPRLNAGGGRDHWGGLAPLLLSGAGTGAGGALGQSTRDGGRPHTQPITNSHLVATVLSTLLRPDLLRLASGVPESVVQAATAEPIPLSG